MDFEDLSMSDIRLLLEVAEAGSIRRVALRRNIAQPALSRKIQILESCFGSPIFDRNRKGVDTTAFGKHSLALLSEWRTFGIATSRRIAESVGEKMTIKLGTYDSVAIYFFPRLLQLIKSSRLNCSVELHLNRSREIVRAVADGRIDVGLVFLGGFHSPNLRVKHVATDEYGFFESTVRRSSDDFHTIGSSADDQGETIAQSLKRSGLERHRLVDSPSFEVAAALTVAGVGIGILPIRVAQFLVDHKKLRPIQIGARTTFGKHQLSVVRVATNRNRTIEKLIQLIEGDFVARR